MVQLDFLTNTSTNLSRAPDRRSASKCDTHMLTEGEKAQLHHLAMNFKDKEQVRGCW